MKWDEESLTSNHKSKTIGFYPNIGQQVQQHNKLLKQQPQQKQQQQNIYLERIITVIAEVSGSPM